MARYLLVSDNEDLVSLVEMAFASRDGDVFVAQDQVEAMFLLDRDPCDVVLLEVNGNLPQGLAFCRIVRQSWDAGIFLLMHPSALQNVVLAYQMGAEGYVPIQNLDLRELVVRVESLAKRVQMGRQQEKVRPAQVPTLVRG